ncbi:lysophospholipid acyltransferase family protein [Williamsia sp. DF01-3]|uniref:lysophospholipid acyltransferase family protein n=1 Tax=Williamsia sp. DF01-3 TaxID=2934157 RepID=UPI0035B43DBE
MVQNRNRTSDARTAKVIQLYSSSPGPGGQPRRRHPSQTNGHPAKPAAPQQHPNHRGHPNTDEFVQAPVTPISEDVRAQLEAGRFEQAAEMSSNFLNLDGVRQTIADTITGAAGYVRQRVTGDYEVDDFGFDAHFTESVWLPALRVLFDKWFRVDVSGIENLPLDGGGLLVANHAGTIPIDALMTSVAVHDYHPRNRHLRVLAADLAFDTPVIGDLARRTGSTLACTADAQKLLRGGELTAVWPEGFKGIGKLYKDRYKLQRFGRGGFVTTALRAKVPIIPVSIVGSEEIYPMLNDLKPIARLLGLPYIPITPTFPLLGPLGLVPLPSKWQIHFGTPIETGHFDDQAADDPMVVFDLTDNVREDIQQTLFRMLSRRSSIYFG